MITADHGGHGRSHGTELDEDMNIPFFVTGPGFEAGKELTNFNIKDIAPTVCRLFGVETPPEWDGNSLL